MFIVDESTAESIRRAYTEGGELCAVVELRRHFPMLTDNAVAGACARSIAGWHPPASSEALPGPKKRRGKPHEPAKGRPGT